jgi:tetratricopeptide (TPR) repeat protein
MSLRPRDFASKALTTVPAYKVLPPGAVRSYAGLRYLGTNTTQNEVAEFVRSSGAPSTRFLSTSMIAARAAFHVGQDEVVDQILAEVGDRFPDSPEPHLLRSDLFAFRGRHSEALAEARAARWLEPASTPAAVRIVRLAYIAEAEHADDVALEMLRRFPRSSPVLWAVAKTCTTEIQYERIIQTWRSVVARPGDLEAAVRQLGTAAGRAGRVEDAVALYGEAMERMVGREETPTEVRETRLEGKGAWQAIEDLTEVLDAARVPFFFAAGTALGLVREGRPLALDGDIDVGVLDRDWDRDALVELFRSHPRFDFDVVHPRTKKLGLKHRGGSPVDIFRFYEEAGELWHDAVFVRWHNQPFAVERRTLHGIDVPVPAESDRYLTENYGDWRTPWPGFDAFTDDAPNVETTWPEYLVLHQVRRAYKRLTAGDLPAALEELRRAGHEDIAARLQARSQQPRIADAAPPAPQAEPDTPAVLARSRRAREQGDRKEAVEILESTLRSGAWKRPALWSERLSLMDTPADYASIRSLWLASPTRCRSSISIMRTVARAASIAGEHDEARALLRAAILTQTRARKRPRAILGRARRRMIAKLPDRSKQNPDPRAFENNAALALADLNRQMDVLGVRSFLISGTLLGYVRESDFISWDKDIDVGVFTKDIDPAELEAAFDRMPEFNVRRLDFTADRLRVNHSAGVAIDVFPHYEDGDGKVWHDGTATRWWNSPFELKTVEFLGLPTWVPEVPERYLDENYGDWRTPDPHFDARMDAPNVDVTDPDYFDTLMYFGLLDAVVKDKPLKRTRFADLVRKFGEGAWVDRV